MDRKTSTNNARQNNGKLMVKMRQNYTKECKTLLNFDKRDVATTDYRHSNFNTAIAWNRPFIAKELKYLKSAKTFFGIEEKIGAIKLYPLRL